MCTGGVRCRAVWQVGLGMRVEAWGVSRWCGVGSYGWVGCAQLKRRPQHLAALLRPTYALNDAALLTAGQEYTEMQLANSKVLRCVGVSRRQSSGDIVECKQRSQG